MSEPIDFAAEATDGAGDPLTGNALVWTSYTDPAAAGVTAGDWRVIHRSATGPAVRSIVKVKPYLGNTNTLEVHDTNNESRNCQLDEIAREHSRWYDALADAKRDLDYDNCHWCIGNSLR